MVHGRGVFRTNLLLLKSDIIAKKKIRMMATMFYNVNCLISKEETKLRNNSHTSWIIKNNCVKNISFGTRGTVLLYQFYFKESKIVTL